MTSYLWNVLVFGNFQEVQLNTTQHLLDTQSWNISSLDSLTEGFPPSIKTFPLLLNASFLPCGYVKDADWI